jgi:hypothetical protein
MSLFLNNTFGERERSHHTWSVIFMEWINDTMLTSSVEVQQGDMVVHMNLDHESMKRILTRVTTI